MVVDQGFGSQEPQKMENPSVLLNSDYWILISPFNGIFGSGSVRSGIDDHRLGILDF
jgi:hypothetical protein